MIGVYLIFAFEPGLKHSYDRLDPRSNWRGYHKEYPSSGRPFGA